MCGFAAIIGPGDSAFNIAMAIKKIEHRGPDSVGKLLIKSPMSSQHTATEDVCIALGHNRLSILDLTEGGQQPQTSACGNYSIIFNGEIYNYIEIRQELQKLGVRFGTESDTEVLLNAYVVWGKSCLTKFVGMFAFAVVDRAREEVFVARDYFGIKPLYYAYTNNSLAIASEIKALISIPGFKVQANPQRCFDYLRGFPTDFGEDTFFNGVSQIPAGHYAVFNLKGTRVSFESYWQVDQGETRDISFEAAAAELRELFLESVALHLRSDVPIGAALSGGIDSSSIVCAIRYLNPQADLHAFGFISSNSQNSEEKWIDIAANSAKAIIHKIQPSVHDLARDIDELVRMQDEPFGSTSIYAQYRVFEEAKKHGIKVLLDGQGADEIFAGYRGYGPARIVSQLQRGQFIKSLKLMRNLATSPSTSLSHVLQQTISHYVPGFAKHAAHKMVGRPLLPEWLSKSWVARNNIATAPLFSLPRTKHYLKDTLKVTLEKSSIPMLLRYEDRDSMAHSIESRVPFLSHKLVQFAYSLPEEYLIDNSGTSKSVFRKAMRGIVPDAILDRRDKIGFETPEQDWMKTLRPWINEVINSDSGRSIPLFDHARLNHDWNETFQGRKPFDFRVWRWVNFIRWVQINNVSFCP